MKLIINFDEKDPIQAEMINVLKNVKRGSKGKVICNGLFRLLSDHGMGNLTTYPEYAGQIIEMITKAPVMTVGNVATAPPVIAAEKKKRKKKTPALEESMTKPPVQDQQTVEVKETPSPAPEPENIPAPAPVTDGSNESYPWRTPDGRVRMLNEEEAEKFAEEHPELVDQYVRELHDWMDAHPEDRPTL